MWARARLLTVVAAATAGAGALVAAPDAVQDVATLGLLAACAVLGGVAAPRVRHAVFGVAWETASGAARGVVMDRDDRPTSGAMIAVSAGVAATVGAALALGGLALWFVGATAFLVDGARALGLGASGLGVVCGAAGTALVWLAVHGARRARARRVAEPRIF
jgi:hypothetical protein